MTNKNNGSNSTRSNRAAVPEAKQALDNMKYEIANERLSIPFLHSRLALRKKKSRRKRTFSGLVEHRRLELLTSTLPV